MRAAYAEGTWRNLEVQHQLYLKFCRTFSLHPLPASTRIIHLYIQFLSRRFKSVDSIRNYVHGVKKLHLWFGYDTDQFHHFSVNMLFKGLTRLKRHMPNQALPITLDILCDFHRLLNLQSPQDQVYWVLFLLAFFLMARKSNLVPDSRSKFDSLKHLQRRDITLKDNMMLVNLKWSKTNQFGARIHRVPILAIPNSVLCPVSAYAKILQSIPLPTTAPIFVHSQSAGWVPLSYSQFQRRLKDLILSSGREPAAYSSHSFRRGGASFASQAGVPREVIKLIGDWRSDAVDAYLNVTSQHKLRAAYAISQHVRLGNSVL